MRQAANIRFRVRRYPVGSLRESRRRLAQAAWLMCIARDMRLDRTVALKVLNAAAFPLPLTRFPGFLVADRYGIPVAESGGISGNISATRFGGTSGLNFMNQVALQHSPRNPHQRNVGGTSHFCNGYIGCGQKHPWTMNVVHNLLDSFADHLHTNDRV